MHILYFKIEIQMSFRELETIMSSGQSLFEAFGVMMICLMLGLLLTISFGVSTDMIRDTFADSGYYNIAGPWVTAQNLGNVEIMNNLILTICYFIPAFGVVNFIITAVRRQRYDMYGNPTDD
jgi:hypothetical protein